MSQYDIDAAAYLVKNLIRWIYTKISTKNVNKDWQTTQLRSPTELGIYNAFDYEGDLILHADQQLKIEIIEAKRNWRELNL